MVILEGTYTKTNGEKRHAQMLKLDSGSDYVAGVDLSKLNAEERKKVMDIQTHYEQLMDKYWKKAYRRFKTENFEFHETKI